MKMSLISLSDSLVVGLLSHSSLIRGFRLASPDSQLNTAGVSVILVLPGSLLFSHCANSSE